MSRRISPSVVGGCLARWSVEGVSWVVRATVSPSGLSRSMPLPVGQTVQLPGRGRSFVVDLAGPTPDAPVVLLFHGLATTAHLNWAGALEALAQRYRVILFDQRWHGRGIASPRFSLEDCADDAAALLDVLGVDHVIAIGYSMGGAVAQVFWRRHGELVAGLVLCSTAAKWGHTTAEQAFYSILRTTNLGLRPVAVRRMDRFNSNRSELPLPLGKDLLAWVRAEATSTSLWALPEVVGALSRFDSRPWIGEIDAPAAVVITLRDRMIPSFRQRELATLIPQATVHEAPGGHTSVIFDSEHWVPILLDAVAEVVVAKHSASRA